MIFRPLELERERLAFSVRPQWDEVFDSWVNRLAARHEVTLSALFRHLDCATSLASLDLVRGKQSLAPRHRGDFRKLIDELAWAVGIKSGKVRPTFMDVPGAWLLPPALRNFGCPRCWLDDLAAKRSLFVRKEWALCASWWCHVHAIPLVHLPGFEAEWRNPRVTKRLGKLEEVASKLARDARPTAKLIECNRRAIIFLLEGSPVPRGFQNYLGTVAGNVFHLSGARIRLMALFHSRNAREAQCFEAFLAQGRNELLRASKGFFKRPAPQKGRLDKNARDPKDRLITVTRWRADIFELLVGYGAVHRRAEARGESIGARADAREQPVDVRHGFLEVINQRGW